MTLIIIKTIIIVIWKWVIIHIIGYSYLLRSILIEWRRVIFLLREIGVILEKLFFKFFLFFIIVIIKNNFTV
jgi:hypothetical protein